MEEKSTRHHAHLSVVMKSDVTLDSANGKGILGTHLAEQELELPGPPGQSHLMVAGGGPQIDSSSSPEPSHQKQ